MKDSIQNDWPTNANNLKALSDYFLFSPDYTSLAVKLGFV